ncbi:MAG: hypothetical protein IPL55_04890 [Saprospiraceae bacterium]|jgi:photosystem II stability/assembly factor-like uncharacterized protein|nr:hypothetical protein [Saprospiraceae bacterium]
MNFQKAKKIFSFILSFIFAAVLFSQNDHLNISDLTFRNIGPANAGGRVVDIEANPNDFTKVYVASASGGVWKSVNAGTTWQPIFDKYETASIGDIAIDPLHSETIWVGTGEANSRNSVSWGNGIYKSTDGGENFENKGLQNTHHISRVLVNPKNSEDVCACALGHLWGYSGDRGLFRTKDGGNSWQKKTNGLPNDGKTGCIDIVRDSRNPNILYAGFYHRLRQPWTFQSGGEQGGIYKSVDGGESWKKLTNGLPSDPTGRIGLAIYEKNPNIIMAIVEAKKSDTLSVNGSGIYRSEDAGKSWKYVNTYNNRPFYYSQIRINPLDDKRVYVLTTRFMVSVDGGKTFTDGSEDQEVHGDFHAMWLDPKNKDRYYLGADKGFSLTHDHGAHFQLIDNLPISQFYRINFDMQSPYYIYGGLQDNGSYATASFGRDARGILNDQNWKMHWGDGQDAAVNPSDHTEAYTGMENGHYFKYNTVTRELNRISPSFNNVTNFSQFFKAGDTLADLIRFNWSSPFVMSSKDPSVLYLGGNHIYKSENKGNSWKIISPDLSTNDPVKRKQGVSGGITPDNSGAETHCAVFSISVSSISEDIIWAGTDDGLIQITKDGGSHWTNVRSAIQDVTDGLWVSRIEASHFEQGRAYVTFDGHRSDHFGTWIFMTDDFGKSWKKITNGISEGETVRVIREDPVNEGLLFIGTETGVWMTRNRGQLWERMNGLPTVSVYDIKIHPRDHDLIIATHGRGIWVMDDISPLEQMTSNMDDMQIHLFNQRETVLWENVSRGGQRGHFWWAGENPKNIINTSSLPKAEFRVAAPVTFYIGSPEIDSVQIKISDPAEKYSSNKMVKVHPGLNRYYWDREFDATSYTTDEKDLINQVFKESMVRDNSTYYKTLYQRFVKANTPVLQRRVVQQLTSGTQKNPLPKRFGILEAEEGNYEVQISFKDKKAKSSLSIIKDSLKD